MLSGNTRYMQLYFGKIIGQSEFVNIITKLVEVAITVLADSSTKYSFLVIFGPNSPDL
jgi:hypothetical protein